VRAGIVTLHGASDGRARQPLFDHLAHMLVPLGVAVLSYDRRPPQHGGDTPLQLQADDAIDAVNGLRTHLRRPVGLFGFSQGAWAASLAAADPATSFLIVLGCSGVSPANQMRYFTDELLRRQGYSTDQRRQLADLRAAYEDHLRRQRRSPSEQTGAGGSEKITARLQAAAAQPWFEHAYLPTSAAPTDHWHDMDFDPTPNFDKITCPVLAAWGSDEECVPAEASKRAWHASRASVTTAELPGCGHWPAVGSGTPGYHPTDDDQLSPDFDAIVTQWLRQQLDQPTSSIAR
jgi:pimeloyl-ACP methyl ester carboxylesterase